MIRNIWYKFAFIILSIFLISCSNDNEEKEKTNSSHQRKLTQLNISFLLDLSDRIDPAINSEQSKRDQEAILSVEEYFKSHVAEKNAHFIKDKIRVLFHPRPETDEISKYADSLNINFGEKNANKKKIFEALDSTYKNHIAKLYSSATKREKYEGSGIWHFMKDDVRQRCVVDEPNYRNILVILTDGYMYWPYDKRNKGNRYNYITGRYEHFNKFRNVELLNSKFEQEDYGFIPVQDSLQNLEVLVVGVNPPKEHPQDFDIIKRYWEKWFKEMKVKDYTILKADLPNATEDLIKRFLKS